MTVHNPHRPVIALAMGDPAGISTRTDRKAHLPRRDPRLCAPDRDRRPAGFSTRARGSAGVSPDLPNVTPAADPRSIGDAAFMDIAHLDPVTIERGVASQAGGAFALENYRRALTLARDKRADAVCFTPFNKKAIAAGASASTTTRSRFPPRLPGLKTPASEFNVLDKLWNARVTSHIALRDVASLLSVERIHRALTLDERVYAAGRICNAPHRGWPGSTRMPAMAAISAARRSTSSSPPSRQAGRMASPWKGRFRPTRFSCAPRAAPSMRCSRCITTRARSR